MDGIFHSCLRIGENLINDDHICDMFYRGIRVNCGLVYWDIWVCSICGREEWRPYIGANDTDEWRI